MERGIDILLLYLTLYHHKNPKNCKGNGVSRLSRTNTADYK